MTQPLKQTAYRVDGLSCVNCAGKFEQNVKNIEGVTDAKINFGAGKIIVYGEASISEIEKAGAFENLRISNANEYNAVDKRDPFIKKNWHIITASILILLAQIFQNLDMAYESITTIMYLVAIIVGGFKLFKEGFKDLLKLNFSMQSLMTIAIIGAAIIGEWTEGAIVVILFAVSEALEGYSMDKARQSIRSLMDIAPKEALIRRNDLEQIIKVNDIQIGDIMIIKPGQKIAMDGIVRKGSSSINQAAITGESIPIEKTIGDEVFAGTLNEEGFLEIEVTKHVEDTTISKIIHLVEEAQSERAPAQAFVDKFAKYYTPIVMLIALLVVVIPPLFFGGDWEVWIYQGLSVLVIACPCALVISTPVSIVSAIGNAAKHGVIVKGGIYLEEIGKVQAIAFDKTGTLTKGTPIVTDFITFTEDINETDLFSTITSLEALSQHPIASAIVSKALENKLDYKSLEIEEFSAITGKGVTGSINNTTYYVGNSKLFESNLKSNPHINDKYQELQNQGKTVLLFGTTYNILAIIAVADEVRKSSKNIITILHKQGINTIMLTGDNNATAQFIGEKIGVDVIKAELMPEDKLKYVRDLKDKYSTIAMVGDGVNDAPALAASNIGIAMGGIGTDTTLEVADIALMGDDLNKLPYVINLSKKTSRIIKQNITFSIAIKLFALLLVIPGVLTLWIAIFADMGATLIVTLNALRLMRVKK